MRTWIVLLLLSSITLCGMAPPVASDQERDRVQGNWIISSIIDDGEMVPESSVKSHLVFEGRISIRGALLSYVNPENLQPHEAAFILSPGSRPKGIDLVGQGRTGSKGIYMIDGDSLVVCLSAPDAKERPKEFGSPKGSKNLLIWLKRDRSVVTQTVNRTAPVSVPKPPPPQPPTLTPAQIQERMRRQLIGTWGHQNSDDVVLITFNPDGSFSSTRTPKRGFRKVFRDPVRISGSWKLEDSIIVVRVTASTQRDLQGQILSYRVRSLSDTQITLIDSTGRMHVEWRTP